MSATDQSSQGGITSLYSKVVGLYSAVPYHLSRSGRSLPTWHYYMEITRRCNLRCKMCQYIDWLNGTPTGIQADGELTTEEWLSVIDQTNRFGLITFTGGEVFVRKDFMEIFEHACSKRRVHFISNATMIPDDRARRCIEQAPKRLGQKGLNFVGISFDGVGDIHDEIRAQRGAYEKSLNGVRSLAKHRNELGKRCPVIHINCVIQKANLECLPAMPKIMKDAGADIFNLLTEMRSHDVVELGHVDPGDISKDDIQNPHIDRPVLDEVLQETMAKAKEVGIEVRMPRTPYEAVLDHYDGGYDIKDFECRAIWTNLYIGAKGGVYPCFINKVGNVRDNTLKELWNSSQMREFRQRRREAGFAVCRGCCELEHKNYKSAFSSAAQALRGDSAAPVAVSEGITPK